jgi:hypothetical protein
MSLFIINLIFMKTKIKIFALALLFVSSMQLSGRSVDLETAKRVAINFYYERVNQFEKLSYNDIKIANHKEYKIDGTILLYTFFMKPAGFVIVSASDMVQPVLAYSFKGTQYVDNIPDAVKERLSIYSNQIKYISDNNLLPDPKIINDWNSLSTDNPTYLKVCKSKSVQPLLTCTWDQDKYYNEACPVDPAGPGGHALAGCVATAIGQIMYYYRWPEQGTGSYTYVHPVYGTISADFGNTSYKWNKMTDHISASNSAIAELLFHIGVSVDMNYGPNGSGMYNHKAGYIYRTYFKYVPETHYIFRDSTNIDWDSVLITHLDKKMPLYYAGWTADSLVNISGHAFVCDGYQDSTYFHFNWGWNGIYNGYFYLNDLNPGASHFNYGHEVVANIFPDTVNYNYPLYCNGQTLLSNTEGTFGDGSGPVNDYMNNTDCMWLIEPQDPNYDSITEIKLKFSRFNTEDGADSVIIYDGTSTSDPVLGAFSGNTIPPTITSSSDKLLVRFLSNGNTTAEGWMAYYYSVFPVYCNNEVLTSYHDTISDGSGNKRYGNNTMCNWYINPPNAKQITLHFTEFDTESTNDYVSIFDPGTTPSTLLAKFSGSTLPPAVTSPSGKMFITFFTNETINGEGWKAYYDTIGTTSVKELENIINLSVYPTPCNDELNISFNIDEKEEIEILVLDLSGKLTNSVKLITKAGINKHAINTSMMLSGVYNLRIITRKGIVNKTIVKI